MNIDQNDARQEGDTSTWEEHGIGEAAKDKATETVYIEGGGEEKERLIESENELERIVTQ